MPFAVTAFAMALSMLQRKRKAMVVAGATFWIALSPLWIIVVFVAPDPSNSSPVIPFVGVFSVVMLVAFAGYGLLKWSSHAVETQS